jgi:hypothetical protein
MPHWMLLGALAWAAPPATPADAHLDLFREARDAETELRFDDAVQACAEALEVLPDGPRAPTCERRLSFLEARRDADGSFASWTLLQDVRGRARTEDRSLLRDELRRVYGREAVSEVVRAELEVWLARDALDRLDDPTQALPYTRSMYAEVDRLDEPRLRQQAVQLHATTLARLGRVDEAHAVEQDIRIPSTAPRPTPVQQVVRNRWQAAAAVGCALVVGVFVLVGLPLSWRGWSARPRPLPTGVIAIGVGTGGAGLLAAGWATGAGSAVPWMLAAFLAIHLVSAGALHAWRRWPPGRAGLRVLAAAATLATGYLALYGTGTLSWVGL